MTSSSAAVVVTADAAAAERFLSEADVNLMALRYTVSVKGDAEITLESGIDGRI